MATDNFTRTDSADLGTLWDEITGDNANGFDIISNQAFPANRLADSSEAYNGITWNPDQYSEVTIAFTSAFGLGAGLGPICRNTALTAKTFYRLVGNGSGYDFGRFDTGTYTPLSGGTGTTFASGDTIRLEVTTSGANCAWVLKNNGTQFASGTDTSPIASGKAGIASSSDTSTSEALSGWAGDNLSVAASSLPGSNIHRFFANLIGL